MTVAAAIARYLYTQGVTDAFGIPGGVILDLLYALEAQSGIAPHLCYHEQSAGFAACGYAQISGRLGVAYATKGPGFTNLLTPIADAYYDSVPVLFLTAHSCRELPHQPRLAEDQEMDSCSMVRGITKYARRVDDLEALAPAVQEACQAALSGRQGPVLLDILSGLFRQETEEIAPGEAASVISDAGTGEIGTIIAALRSAKRPLVLVGDGINQAGVREAFNRWLEAVRLPVVSSRCTHDVVGEHALYYGYVGSHGIRYAHFVLSKADCILALGNRLAFPEHSSSFAPIVQKARILRCEIDEAELERHRGIADAFRVDLACLQPLMVQQACDVGNHEAWLSVCNTLRSELRDSDCPPAVGAIESVLRHVPEEATLVCDVGNNEFWVSRACVHLAAPQRTLYSKSFGSLGNALGKSVGVYYATRRPVIVFVGDQGFQLNLQELQYIAQHHLPITIVLLNNAASGMIRDRECATGHPNPLHTTEGSGYSHPNFEALTTAYGIRYQNFADCSPEVFCSQEPFLLEIVLGDDGVLTPSLPRGSALQDMFPELERNRYNMLNNL